MKIVAALLFWLTLPAFSQSSVSVVSTLPNDGTSNTRVVDLNGDGQLDLVSFGFNSVSVRLNDGTGKFSPAVTYTLTLGDGASPSRAYTTGDFNRDGNLDVAVVTNVGIYFSAGDGKGGFGPAQRTAVQADTRTQSAVTGDFNGDGFLDIAISGFGTGLRLFLGNGSGDFSEHLPMLGGLPFSSDIQFQAVDANNDGILDLLGVDAFNEAFYVFVNDGTGTFRQTQLFQPDMYTRSESFYAADFDRDGKLDVAITINRAIVGSNTVTLQRTLEIWMHVGAGVFAKTRTLAMLPDQVSVAAADLNGDGNPDLILAGTISTSFYIGDGTGLFRDGGSVAVTGSIALGDLMKTGRTNIVLTNSKAISLLAFNQPSSRVNLYRNLNPFTFGQTEVFTATVDSDPALSGFPTGTVQFLDNGKVVQTAVLFNGVAHFAVPFSAGQHQFRVDYSGDSQYGAGSAELAVSEAGVPASLTGFASPIAARVSDVKGNPVGGVGVIFAAPSVGPSGTFLGSLTAVAITGADGLAQAPLFTGNGIKGMYSIAVTLSGYPGIGAAILIGN